MQNTQKKSRVNKDLIFSLVSVFLALLIGGIVIIFAGCSPLDAYTTMFKEIFKNFSRISYMLNYVIPLIFTGLSVAFAFRTGLFNIGAEGQYMIGALTAALLGYFVKLPAILHIPFVFVVGCLAGGFWGWISGYLKSKFKVNEVISNIMLNWIAFYISNFVVMLNGFKVQNSSFSHSIQGTARISITSFPQIFGGANLNSGVLVAIIAAILVNYLIFKTTIGFRLRAVGYNRLAAQSAGINVEKSMAQSMFIAGILAGMAGVIQVMGCTFRVNQLGGFVGHGMDGMAVSLVGLNHPLGVMLSALLLGFLKYGVTFLQSDFAISDDVVQIIIGSIMFFVAISFVIRYMLNNLIEIFKDDEPQSAPVTIEDHGVVPNISENLDKTNENAPLKTETELHEFEDPEKIE